MEIVFNTEVDEKDDGDVSDGDNEKRQEHNGYEEDEFDMSSDEEDTTERENQNGDERESPINSYGEISTSTNFLIGARSRFGRAIRLNNRLLF